MSDLPEAFQVEYPHARKTHCCYECARQILPGCKHQKYSGIWDGEPARFRTCILCATIRDAVNKLLPRGEDPLAFGELGQYLRDCHSDVPHAKEWLALLQDKQLSFEEQGRHVWAVLDLTDPKK